MQTGESLRHQPDGGNLALYFIFFCIACVAMMGVVLMAYVYWGFQ
ncbi:MAG TPA: hypothetical protein VGL29_22240 [Blastocatellia bacterium]|jgi:hypothetical protein